MREPLLGDVVAAARALRAVTLADRPARLAALLDAASEADCHRQKTGRSHPRLGDGSLMAAALAGDLAPEPPLTDTEYCRCLSLVLTALAGQAEPSTRCDLRLSS